MMVAMLASVSLVACDDDDNNEPIDPEEPVKLELDYKFEISQEFLDLFDIKLVYEDADGNSKEVVVNSTNWEKQLVFKKSEDQVLVTKVNAKLVFKLKKNHPTIDYNKTYSLGVGYTLLGKFYNGLDEVLHSTTKYNEYSTIELQSKEEWDEFLSEGTEFAYNCNFNVMA